MKSLKEIDGLFEMLKEKDDKIRYPAFKELLQITENKVDWIYDKWHELIEKLSSDNSYQRSIALMLLANLAKSDTENRFFTILEQYLDFFEDDKFITSRQCIQNVWKIAIINDSYKKRIVAVLENNYYENRKHHKHFNLIKQDIISSLHQIYCNTKDKNLMQKINELINSEIDEKLVRSR